MSRLLTYYDTLQISRTASPAVIKAAYKALSQKYHPDKNQYSLERAHENMKRLNEAYAVLSDVERRDAYDAAIDAEEQDRSRQAGFQNQNGSAPRSTEARTPTEPFGKYPDASGNATFTSDREKREGKSRFDHSNTNKTATFTQHVDPVPEKKTNVFTAFFVGFSEAIRGKPAPDPQSIANAASPKKARLNVWHCLALCSIGAWILAKGTATRLKTGHSELPAYRLIFDPGFLGMVASPLLALLAAALVGSSFAAVSKRARPFSASFGFAAALVLFAMLIFGGQISDTRTQGQSLPAPAGANSQSAKLVAAVPLAAPR